MTRFRLRILGRSVFAITVAALLICAPASHVPAEQVTATLDADQVDFSYDRKLVTLSGNARVHSQVVDDPSRFVKLRADTIEGDLSRGRFELLGDVSIITPQGALTGESAFYDTQRAEYSLRRAALMAPLTDLPDATVHGYAYAREITGENEIVYLIDARFTTCDRVEPHYCFAVDRLRWDTRTQQIVVEGGGIELYGLRIPLLPTLRHSFAADDEAALDTMPIPGYTGREGLRLGWQFLLGEPTDALSGHAGLALRQRKGLQTWAWGSADIGPLAARFGAGLRENNDGDIDNVISLDRLPEIGITGAWDLADVRSLSAGLTLGHYRQRAEDTIPRVEEDRALIEATVRGGIGAPNLPGSSWWWLRGSHALYGDGAHYSTIGGGLGAAATLTPWLSGSAELRHHLTDGASPFAWDDIDIETELDARGEFTLDRRWRLRLGGRYDLDRDEMRHWNVELRRREHCLTWKLGYSDRGEFFSMGVEIDGLFGNHQPPPQGRLEDGPPDFWTRPAEADGAQQAGEDRQQSDYSASEAMEPQ